MLSCCRKTQSRDSGVHIVQCRTPKTPSANFSMQFPTVSSSSSVYVTAVVQPEPLEMSERRASQPHGVLPRYAHKAQSGPAMAAQLCKEAVNVVHQKKNLRDHRINILLELPQKGTSRENLFKSASSSAGEEVFEIVKEELGDRSFVNSADSKAF